MEVVRWTAPANSDFLGIVEWLKSRNPDAAARIGREILASVERLSGHPRIGRPGRAPQTAELKVRGLPYMIVYSIHPGAMLSDPERITVFRVLHRAMLRSRPTEIK